jgi:hypothetical protein
VSAFARWDRIAAVRRRARGTPITPGTLGRAKTQIIKAIAFLTWLEAHGQTLATCRQHLVDLWLTAEGHQANYNTRQFVTWAVRSGLAHAINIPARPQRHAQQPLGADERWSIARRLLHDDALEIRDRVAGC